jgi:hypothetical protein
VTTCLNGRYRLRRELGRGGMATVWHADDLLLQRPVAVKMLHPDLSGDPLVRHRIRDEALAAAALAHPHIANVYDYGEHPDDHGGLCPYLVMELVDGPTLEARLADTGPLPWRQAAQIGAAVADALAAAHAHGVVHRDVKPGNVILGATGVKVVDFGVAAGVGQDPADANGVVWGTPAYLPPESAAATVATTAGDVYALGLLLTVCLTGRLPHRSASGQVIRTSDHDRPAADIPQAAHVLLRTLLAPDPADRPTAAAVSRSLSAIGTNSLEDSSDRARIGSSLLRSYPQTTTVLPATARARRRRLRRPPVLAGAGLAAAATVVVAAQAADVGEPVGAEAVVAPVVSCAADYALQWRSDGTFTARLSVTSTGGDNPRHWRIRFALPTGQRLTEATGAAWVQQRRTVTLTAHRQPTPGGGITAVMAGTADSTKASVPRRFAVNDEFCGRVDTSTSTSPPKSAISPTPPKRQPHRVTAAAPTPVRGTTSRSAAAVDTPSAATESPVPTSSPSRTAPSPDPTVSGTGTPSPTPTETDPNSTPTGSTKPTASATPSRTTAPTASGSPQPPASPSDTTQSSVSADVVAADESSGEGMRQ